MKNPLTQDAHISFSNTFLSYSNILSGIFNKSYGVAAEVETLKVEELGVNTGREHFLPLILIILMSIILFEMRAFMRANQKAVTVGNGRGGDSLKSKSNYSLLKLPTSCVYSDIEGNVQGT